MMKQTFAVALLGLATGLLPAADFPSHEIKNKDIKAKIYLPDAKNGFYRSTRFDWSGVIGSLEYKGHNFYGPWFKKITDVYDFGYEGEDVISAPFTAMVGPGEEFGVIGYNDVKPGGTFIKPGVGVLRRADDTPYNHSKTYEIVDGGKWTVKKNGDSVEWTQSVSDPTSGYGYVYSKTVKLTKNMPQMTISHTLKNTGSKKIESNVYDHNFLTLDGQAPGPDFEITFPFEVKAPPARGGAGGGGQRGPNAGPGGPNAGQRGGGGRGANPTKDLGEFRGNHLAYLKALEKEDRMTAQIGGFGETAKDYDIRVENKKVGAGVHITGDRPLLRIGYWSIKTVMAVEPYIDIVVEPGKDLAWKYTYDYYTLPESK